MDWLILIVSLPAIIVPVVLLFGFAGCGLTTAGIPSGDGDGRPGTEPGVCPVPQNFSADALSDSAILLTWDIEADMPYLIEGVLAGGNLSNPTQVILAGPDPAGTTVTTGQMGETGLVELLEGRTYIYQVKCHPNNWQMPDSDPSDPSSATVWPKTPSDLVATPVGLAGIDLTWNPGSTAPGVEFQLEYSASGSPFQELPPVTDTTYPHRDLVEGSQYDYRVFSIVLGFEHSVQQVVRSAASAVVSATTFKPAFELDPTAAPNIQPGWVGDYCFVQRISASKLLAGGGKVGIKVRGAPASNVTINRIYISRVAASGNFWDSAGDLTKVLDSLLGDSPLMLPNDQPVDLDPIDYNLDKSQDLIIAFDFTATPGADTIAYVSPEPGVTLYFKQSVQQASLPTRDPDYSTQASQLYLVVTIGVP